jgi:hypothetical protein
MRVSSLWWRAPLLGALIGLPVLGIGGRVAMRIIAMYTRPVPFLSFEGTLTVVLSGMASGIAGAIFYALLDWRLPRYRAMRGVLFAAFLGFVTARGLHPVELLPLALFSPLVVLYGVVLERSWHRVRLRSSATSVRITA